MKLKPGPRGGDGGSGRRGPGGGRGATGPRGAAPRGASPAQPSPPRAQARAARPRKATGAHARRRGLALPAPHMPRLLAGGRLLAAFLAIVVAGGLVFLVNGPWLRVASIAWGGVRYTSTDRLDAVLDPMRGTSLLALDAAALGRRLEQIPSVAAASVETRFPDGLQITVEERAPALIWQTTAVRLVVDADGMVFGEIALRATLPPEFAALPRVDDRRPASHNLIIGSRIDARDLATAEQLAAIAPAALGSAAKGVTVRIDARCGYTILPQPAASWAAAFGFYGLDVGDQRAVAARIADQVGAVRTLFATHRENTVGWIDARNPGKVYWRANGAGSTDTC